MFLEPLEDRQVMAVAVEAFTPNASGFVVDFTEAIATDQLSLYDAQNGALGVPDVQLTDGSGGVVNGSLVVAGDKLTFLKTGGPLAAGSYTATLRSAANAVTDQALGQLLDGEFNGSLPSGNGVPGGDFVFTFSVAAPQALVVSLPDFARGPTQLLQAPATGSGQALTSGLPIRFSEAAGVTSFTMTITYDPALLTITGADLGADAPPGSQVQANVGTPGQITLAFFALDPLGSGGKSLINLLGSVPEDAVYGATGALAVSALEVNAGAIQATADSALHVVAFPGDANANRRYDAEDARLIARTGIGLDSGFVTTTPTASTPAGDRIYPFVDPVIIGDVTGVDGLSPLDASDVLRLVVGLPVPNIPALPAAQAPTALNLSALSVGEGLPIGTTVGVLTTTDPDLNDTHTYSLVSGTGGEDNASFTISGNTLQTAAVFNQSVKSSYSVRIRTTDSTGRSLERTFTIAVTHANAAPTSISLGTSLIAENATSGTAVGTLHTIDPNAGDTFTYTLVSGDGDADNGSFTIVGNQLVTASALDFEAKSTYTVRVRSVDQGGLSFEQLLDISVTNVNEQPTSLSLSHTSVAEGTPAGTAVGSFGSVDPDAGDLHTYTLVAGDGDTGNASFVIVGNELRTDAVLDQSTQSAYSIRVRTTDSGGLSFEQVFTITVTEANAAPTSLTLTGNQVSEDAPLGTNIGAFSTVDPNETDSHTYSLASGEGDTDNAAFVIVGAALQTAVGLNFESRETYSIRVRSTDSFGLFVEQALTISVTDVNEAPTAIALDNSDIAENLAAGATVGQLSALDQDAGDSHTFTLVAGEGDTDNAAFVIVGAELQTAATFDFETKSNYSVRIRGTDAGGFSFERMFAIDIVDVNEAPTAIDLSNATVPESEPVDIAVGVLTAADPDAGDTQTFALVSGDGDTDNASFAIVGAELRTAAVFDLAVQDSYSVRVRTTDAGGLSFERIFTITITEANAAPTAVALSANEVAEDAPLGTAVGVLSTTDPNTTDTHTYSLVAGDGDIDNAAFVIVGDTLQTAVGFDFETQETYSVRVRSTDSFGLFVEQTLTISVTNVNEAPTAIALDSSDIAEDLAAGATVGLLSAADQDAGDSHTFTLVAGEGDADNAAFVIVGAELQSAATFDFETKSNYSVRVRGVDAAGLAFEQVLAINVTNVNEAPMSISLSNTSIPENEPVGARVGTLGSLDPDTGDAHTYSLVAGDGDTDNAAFEIVGAELRSAAVFEQAVQSVYSVRVRTTDAAGLTFEQVFSIEIAEPNIGPTSLSLSANTVAEDAAIGTVVGTFSTVDPNAIDSHAYLLVSGDGDEDNASFTVVDNELRTAVGFDFESQATYSIRVRSVDAFGLFWGQSLTITVTDVNESPTELSLSNDVIAENSPIGSLVGTFFAADPDTGDSHSWTLVAGEGDTDNAAFTLVGGELRTNVELDFETQSVYSIRVQGVDNGGLTFAQTFLVTVTNVNEAPTAITLDNSAVQENSAIGAVIGLLGAVDPDAGDSHTYSLVAGEGDIDNALLSIVGSELQTAAVLDFESQGELHVRVRSVDALGLSIERELIIAVLNANDAPTALSLSNQTIVENLEIGSLVGLISGVDPDSGDELSYALVAGDGDSGNGAFQIVGAELRTNTAFDAGMQTVYSVRIRVTDQIGADFEQILEIQITPVTE